MAEEERPPNPAELFRQPVNISPPGKVETFVRIFATPINPEEGIQMAQEVKAWTETLNSPNNKLTTRLGAQAVIGMYGLWEKMATKLLEWQTDPPEWLSKAGKELDKVGMKVDQFTDKLLGVEPNSENQTKNNNDNG